MLALLLVAVSLGLTNFAAAIAIGITGVDRRLRLRVALAFGVDPRTAQRYIEKARAAGLLPPSGKQRKQ